MTNWFKGDRFAHHPFWLLKIFLCERGHYIFPASLQTSYLWKGISAIILCIRVSFCLLAISFYFVNCVIISCKLSFNSIFTRNQIPFMSILGFKKAELGCQKSELHVYVVKRQN